MLNEKKYFHTHKQTHTELSCMVGHAIITKYKVTKR